MTATAVCPERDILADFILGKLGPPELESVEQHLADCDACDQTIRSLDTSDTVAELTRAALVNAEQDAAELGDEQSVIDDLISRFQLSSADISRSAYLIADRAAEVVTLLEPAADDQCMGRLGEYDVLELLGAGSTGVVFRARDRQLQRMVALKVLRPSLGVAARERFLVEARAAAAIDHQNVVTIYQVGQHDSLAYIAMQWTAGGTLEQWLEQQPALAPDEVLEIARQVTQGLLAAHAQGLIHRDIKPANIWVSAGRDRVTILDFGLARIVDDDPQFTATGVIAGTPTFMSPEQARGDEIDARSDLFSLGCVLYRMLTASLPFRACNVLATLQSVQNDRPAPPRTINPSVPPGLSDLVMCLLAKDPAQRPACAADVLRALDSDPLDWPFSVPASLPQHMAVTKAERFAGYSIRWWVMTAVVVLLILGGFFYGPQIVRIVTGKGQIVIKTDDPNVKIQVMQDGQQVRIIDLQTEQSLEIKEGQYELQIAGDTNSVDISPSSLRLYRGGKQIVEVTKTETGQLRPASPTDVKVELKQSSDGRTWLEFSGDREKVEDAIGQLKGSMNETGQPGQLPSTTESTYEGENLEYWLNKTRTEKSLEQLQTAIKALVTLRTEESAPRIARAIMQTLRTHGRGLYPQAVSAMPYFSADVLVPAYLDELVNGNASSRDRMAYLLEYLSAEQKPAFRQRFDEFARVLSDLSKSADRETQQLAARFLGQFAQQVEIDPGRLQDLVPILQLAVLAPGNPKQLENVLAVVPVLVDLAPDSEGLLKSLTWLLEARGPQYQETAFTLFKRLGTKSAPALPVIDKLISGPNLSNQIDIVLVMEVLEGIGPEAIPTLEKLALRYKNHAFHDKIDAAIERLSSNAGDYGEPKDQDSNPNAPHTNQLTYNGKDFPYWLATAKTERNLEQLVTVVEALGALATDDTADEICTAIMGVLRVHGSDTVDSEYRAFYEAVRDALGALPPAVVVKASLNEIRTGNANSRAAHWWILDRNTSRALKAEYSRNANILISSLGELTKSEDTEARSWSISFLGHLVSQVLTDPQTVQHAIPVLQSVVQSADTNSLRFLVEHAPTSPGLAKSLLDWYLRRGERYTLSLLHRLGPQAAPIIDDIVAWLAGYKLSEKAPNQRPALGRGGSDAASAPPTSEEIAREFIVLLGEMGANAQRAIPALKEFATKQKEFQKDVDSAIEQINASADESDNTGNAAPVKSQPLFTVIQKLRSVVPNLGFYRHC